MRVFWRLEGEVNTLVHSALYHGLCLVEGVRGNTQCFSRLIKLVNA